MDSSTRGTDDPVVRLVVGQMADSAELGPALELVEAGRCTVGILEAHPRGHGPDPLVPRGLLEQVVGVGVQTGALDEDHGVDAVALQQGRDIRCPERAGDRAVLVGHPWLGRVVAVPHANVTVDQHGHRRYAAPTGSAIESGSVQADPCGNSNRSSDAGNISML